MYLWSSNTKNSYKIWAFKLKENFNSLFYDTQSNFWNYKHFTETGYVPFHDVWRVPPLISVPGQITSPKSPTPLSMERLYFIKYPLVLGLLQYIHIFLMWKILAFCHSTSFLSAPGGANVGMLLIGQENKHRQCFTSPESSFSFFSFHFLKCRRLLLFPVCCPWIFGWFKSYFAQSSLKLTLNKQNCPPM